MRPFALGHLPLLLSVFCILSYHTPELVAVTLCPRPSYLYPSFMISVSVVEMESVAARTAPGPVHPCIIRFFLGLNFQL